MDRLEELSGVELGKLVNKRKISAREVIDYFAARIAKRDATLNAFTYTKFSDALEEADRVDAKLARREHVGPLAGVPIALKDFLSSKKGWKNSHGGVAALVQTDQVDSMFYSAAHSMGAIAIGKTNAPAFGFSGACQNTMYGQTHNPFDISRTSGGSSGGSAAAVADGLVTIAEGGDAGGSIRIPAGWCNLFGMKPSLGTVPSLCRPDGWAATHPYCFNGSLTKTVEDSALMLTHMAKYDPRDPISLPINANKDFVKLMKKPIKKMKVAFTWDFDLYPAVDPEVRYIVHAAAQRLKEAGVEVIDLVKFNFKHSLDEIMQCWAWAISVDTALDLAYWKQSGLDLVKDHRDQLPEEFIHYNEIAAKATIFSMREFNEIRTDILDNFEDVFVKYDVIISPTAICPPMHNDDNGRAIEVAGVKLDPNTNFLCFGETPLANFVGYPAASVPAGLTSAGLPTGMQILGRQYHDEDVLAVAHTFEQIQPWNYERSLNRNL